MANSDGGLEELSQLEGNQTELIHGLPNDISFLCLARVPRRYHAVLNCVSKRWRALLCSEDYLSYRIKHNLHETWIYALCRDRYDRACLYVLLEPSSLRRTWKRVNELPPRIAKRKGINFEVLGKKLYILGGCGWSEDATNEVYCFDASMNTWVEASPLSTERCYFACEVVNEKIYAIGGLGLKSGVPYSWDTYDPHTNVSESYSDTRIIPEVVDSFVMDGKIYIRCSSSNLPSLPCAMVYEPSTGIWQCADIKMALGWSGYAVVVDDTLYMLNCKLGTTLTMWSNETRTWEAVGRFSVLLTKPPCQVVAIGKSIFVISKGCRTLVIDVSFEHRINGFMLSSSLPKLPSDDVGDVIGCKCLAV